MGKISIITLIVGLRPILTQFARDIERLKKKFENELKVFIPDSWS